MGKEKVRFFFIVQFFQFDSFTLDLFGIRHNNFFVA